MTLAAVSSRLWVPVVVTGMFATLLAFSVTVCVAPHHATAADPNLKCCTPAEERFTEPFSDGECDCIRDGGGGLSQPRGRRRRMCSAAGRNAV